MRILMAVPVLIVTGVALGGCNTGAPMGVLPRDPVPPPPSVTGGISKQQAAPARVAPSEQRRGLSVPNRIETPRPTSTRVEPIMTRSGAGAGFRF